MYNYIWMGAGEGGLTREKFEITERGRKRNDSKELTLHCSLAAEFDLSNFNVLYQKF
jgi:hypothetical protein